MDKTWVLWCLPIIRRLGQEDCHEFKVSQGYITGPCLKGKKVSHQLYCMSHIGVIKR